MGIKAILLLAGASWVGEQGNDDDSARATELPEASL